MLDPVSRRLDSLTPKISLSTLVQRETIMHIQQVSRPCAEEVVLAVSLELAMAK